MGRPKALLPWGNETLLTYQVRQLAEAGCDDIVVVLGHEAEVIAPNVSPPARHVINDAYRQGRASSLRAGAAALGDSADPIVVLGVDQPRPAELTSRLLQRHHEEGVAVTVPAGDGRRGHPVVVSGALLGELRAALEEAEGLRGVVAAHEDSLHEVHFMLSTHESLGEPDLTALMVLVDINTPKDYEDALALFGLGRPGVP
jgi:CTP:molybdopterin cytidylyltransferase MocA